MVPPHPLIKHWLAIARNKHSPTPIFRAAIAELGKLLIYELGRDWLPVIEASIDSPVGPADAQYVDPSQPVKVRAACSPPAQHVHDMASGPRISIIHTHSTSQPGIYTVRIPCVPPRLQPTIDMSSEGQIPGTCGMWSMH